MPGFIRANPRRKNLVLLRGLCLGVFPAEALHASGGIDELLLAGEKRMAIRANFHRDVALMGRAGHKCITARAVHAHFVVCGMNSCFHRISAFRPTVRPVNHCESLDSTGCPQDSATRAGGEKSALESACHSRASASRPRGIWARRATCRVLCDATTARLTGIRLRTGIDSSPSRRTAGCH
jgi:hypothetical protein